MGRPDCRDCPEPGACCRYYGELLVGVLLTDEEGPAYPEALLTALGYFLPVKPGRGECIFLDDRGWCMVHDTRKPEVCQRWHCVDDFDEDGRPSGFLEDHPNILRWLFAQRESTPVCSLVKESG